ncbi:hypothetical protein NX059_012054 [Plenodomus lindquistii]|nr:hypothetical protein NX059_012054 [Plenodomus lindquistii]
MLLDGDRVVSEHSWQQERTQRAIYPNASKPKGHYRITSKHQRRWNYSQLCYMDTRAKTSHHLELCEGQELISPRTSRSDLPLLNHSGRFQKAPSIPLASLFHSGKVGEDSSVREAAAFVQGIGSDLFALEVGNEFDSFPVNRTRPYTIEQFIPDWLSRTSAIVSRVLSSAPNKKIFQAGNFVAPGTFNNTSFNASAAINLGTFSTGIARTYCTHQYFGNQCGPVNPTLSGPVIPRTRVQQLMNYHAGAAALTLSKGVPM